MSLARELASEESVGAEPLAQDVPVLADRGPRGLVVEVTPLAGFAAGAFVVSALALAFAVGRTLPQTLEEPGPPQAGQANVLEEVRALRPLRYDELQVDRGTAESPIADRR